LPNQTYENTIVHEDKDASVFDMNIDESV